MEARTETISTEPNWDVMREYFEDCVRGVMAEAKASRDDVIAALTSRDPDTQPIRHIQLLAQIFECGREDLKKPGPYLSSIIRG